MIRSFAGTAILLAAIALAPAHAVAAAVSGNELRQQCDEPKFGRYICMGYIRGVVEMATLTIPPTAAGAFCLPSEVTTNQVVEVVKKYMQDNPERLHEIAAALIVSRLHVVFPCG